MTKSTLIRWVGVAAVGALMGALWLFQGKPADADAPADRWGTEAKGPPSDRGAVPGVRARPAASEGAGRIRTAAPRAEQQPPRLLLAQAQQSASPEDAFHAARGIYNCRWREGLGRQFREAAASSGQLGTLREGDLLARIDGPERACQELDASMKAQYEPMLRRAMAGGIRGAAAMWWVTPEAKASQDADLKASAFDAVRRDAFACDLNSLSIFQVVAVTEGRGVSSEELEATRLAAAKLVTMGRMKSPGPLESLADMVPSWFLKKPPSDSAQDPQRRAAQIVEACHAPH